MEVIPGIELSAQWSNGSMHPLGYYVRSSDEKLRDMLKRLRWMRTRRNQKLLKRLNTCGPNLSESHLAPFSKKGQLGRPHLAKAMVKEGYLCTMEEAYQRSFGKRSPAYVDKERLKSAEAILTITEAGGIPVLAHIHFLGIRNGLEFDARLLKWIDTGLMGIEGYYPDHDAQYGSFYRSLGRKDALIITGETDYHGNSKPDIEIGIDRGRSP